MSPRKATRRGHHDHGPARAERARPGLRRPLRGRQRLGPNGYLGRSSRHADARRRSLASTGPIRTFTRKVSA